MDVMWVRGCGPTGMGTSRGRAPMIHGHTALTMQVETKSVNVQLNLITPDGEPAGRLRKVQNLNGGMTCGTLQCYTQCCTDIILHIRSLAHVQPSNFGPGAPGDCWYATRRLLCSTNWEYTKRP